MSRNTDPKSKDRVNNAAEIPETYDDLYQDEQGNVKSQYRAPETSEEIEAHIEAMEELREEHESES